MMRRVGFVLLALLLVLVAAETWLGLVAGRFTDRSGAPTRGSAEFTVLCIGDSHTYGTGVETAEAYPGRLQRELDREAPGRYRVINRGVAGLSSTMVWHRLPKLARLHDPDVVLVWAGVNDSWNVSEREQPANAWASRADAWLSRSRLYRLWRVRAHGQRLDREVEDAARARLEFTITQEGRRVDFDGVEELIAPRERAHSLDAQTRSLMVDNFASMARWARGAGISLAFLSYPLATPNFSWVNGALREAADTADAPLVWTAEAYARVPEGERELLWAAHPNAAIYAEIARDVAAEVRRMLEPAD